MTRSIRGVLPIAPTPFQDTGEIDYPGLERLVNWAYSQGIDGLCTGMVSELLRLTGSERIELTHRLAEMNAGRGAMVASVGAESVNQAVVFADEALRAGCDAIMAIPPVSLSLPDGELEHYYRCLADRIPLPLIVQDASGYVGRPISLDLCVRLLDAYGPDKILFKPEAAPTGPNVSTLRDRSHGRARIFEGSGGICLVDSYRRGICGSMPGMEAVDAVVALWQALERGDESATYRLYLPLCALVALQCQAGLDGFLAIEKYLLVRRGLLPSAHRRRPHTWELDRETAAEVDRLWEHLRCAAAAVKQSEP
jgi:4-hydroxy-tetrahydrodipicolinate synthase